MQKQMGGHPEFRSARFLSEYTFVELLPVPMPVSWLLRNNWCGGRLADAVQRFLTATVPVIGHSQEQTAVSSDRARHDLVAHVVLRNFIKAFDRWLEDCDNAIFAGCVNVPSDQNR